MSHVPVWKSGLLRWYPRLPARQGALGLIVDRTKVTAPGAGLTVVIQHDIDIPEGYVAEIWGCEIMSSGFLDTGGVLEYFLSLDDDVTTAIIGKESDDVIFSGQFETLLVTTGGGMVVGRDRAFFPRAIVTARDIIQWIIYCVTDWSASSVSVAIYYALRKATKADIVELLIRRR